MPLPTPEQLDTFAQGMAAGLSIRQAALRAGYGPHSSSYYRWPKRASFMAKVEKFRRLLDPAATADLEPIIKRLLAAADRVETADGPALRAVRDLLSEAARLKQLLPPPETAGGRATHYEMTREAWLATFAPKSSQ